jgi:hypothetical protein
MMNEQIVDSDECCDCRWFHRGLGECRKRAPYPVQGAPNDHRLFPVVAAYDWCGHYERMAGKRIEDVVTNEREDVLNGSY